MTSSISIDWQNGAVSVDQVPITLDGGGTSLSPVRTFAKPGKVLPSGITRYRSAQKASVCGFVADIVVDVKDGALVSIALLFELIEFFDRSILESKILKAIEKKSGLRANSSHPAVALLEPCPWGKAEFSYDPRQGDLSLLLQYS
jgi:hypothetical protein